MKESLSITIKKPLETVFDAMTDIDQLASWAPAKVSFKKVPDRPKSGLGSAVIIASPMPGMGDVLCETTEWDRPRACTRTFHIKDLPTKVSIRLKEKKGETKVDIDIELEPQSMMYRMALPVLASKMRADKERALKELQKKLQSEK